MNHPELIERLLHHDEGLDSLKATATVSAERLETIRTASTVELCGSEDHPSRAVLLRACLFYFCGSLDEAHRLVQDASGDLAAYLHGMIHRREEDFDNARYWFRRAGELPFFAELHQRGSELSADVARQVNWDPYLFTMLCERQKYGAHHPLPMLVGLQKAEFAVFLDYVLRAG